MVTDVAAGDGVEITGGKFPVMHNSNQVDPIIKYHNSPLTVIAAADSVNMLGNMS